MKIALDRPRGQHSSLKNRLKFSDGNREAHLLAFYEEWLPKALHTAPGIAWANLPSRALGYCVNTVAESPDKAYVAFAIGAAIGALGQTPLYQYVSRFHRLLSTLWQVCSLNHFSALRQREIWEEFAQKTPMTLVRLYGLRTYGTLVENYCRAYMDSLEQKDRDRLACYVLPPLPSRFIDRYGESRD